MRRPAAELDLAAADLQDHRAAVVVDVDVAVDIPRAGLAGRRGLAGGHRRALQRRPQLFLLVRGDLQLLLGRGQAIEEVAKKNPKAIVRLPIDPEEGFPPYKARAFAKQVLKMYFSPVRPRDIASRWPLTMSLALTNSKPPGT